jgi:tyrosine decarboxylase/aspartate 1-decarboxylase
MGLAPIPAGGILFRKEEYLDVMAVDSPYLTVKTQSTIVGTRMGASSAATYAIMKYLGKEGYSKLAEQLMDNTKFLKEGLEDLGYELVCEPELNIVAFNHPNMETNVLAQKLEDLGWKVSVSKCPVAIRIVLMNHIKKSHLKELLEDLKEII